MYFWRPRQPLLGTITNAHSTMRNHVLLALAASCAVFFSCKTDTKCRYKPEPIFGPDLPHIVQYNFEKEGNQSLESMLLDTKVLVEIGQEVCNETRQEFRFTVQGDYGKFPDSMWMKEAVRQLVFLSSFSPQQAPLKSWADALEAARTEMRIGEDIALDLGVSARVDRVVSPEQSTLILVLAQKP